MDKQVLFDQIKGGLIVYIQKISLNWNQCRISITRRIII